MTETRGMWQEIGETKQEVTYNKQLELESDPRHCGNNRPVEPLKLDELQPPPPGVYDVL